jgi:hypothetical protein
MANWSPDLHPRDSEGKFARKGLFHHTRPERAAAIRKGGFRLDVEREHGSLFGVGVNLSTDERSSRLYNTESTKFVTGYDAERLDLQATVRNPYVVKVPTGSPRPGEYVDKQMRRDGILGKGETIGRGTYDPTRGQQITATLQAHGYDAVEVQEVGGVSHEVGGNQLIVFDPRAVHPEGPAPKPKAAPVKKVDAVRPMKEAGIAVRGNVVLRDGQERGTVTRQPNGKWRTSNTGDREFGSEANAAVIAAYSNPPRPAAPPTAPAPKKDRPKTYSVVGPNGEVFTRTSPRPYTHARVLDFGEKQPADRRYSATFHSSAKLASRPHPDFPNTKFTAHKVNEGGLATEMVDIDGNPAPDGVTPMGTSRKPLGPAGLQALRRARSGGRPRDRADVRQRADLRARGLLDGRDKLTPAGLAVLAETR